MSLSFWLFRLLLFTSTVISPGCYCSMLPVVVYYITVCASNLSTTQRILFVCLAMAGMLDFWQEMRQPGQKHTYTYKVMVLQKLEG